MKTRVNKLSQIFQPPFVASIGLMMALVHPAEAQFNFTTNGHAITITGFTGTNPLVTIPNMINGYPVTSIGDSAFQYSILTNVIIPNGVTNIGEAAFYSCRGLPGVMIPSSVTAIGIEAFGQCTSLTTITVDAQNSLYSSVNGALFDKIQSTLVEYPAGVDGGYTIPNGVISIGESAFFSGSLTSVTIPSSVTNIGELAFVGGPLTTITVDPQNSHYSSLNGVLFNKSQSTLVEFPGGVGGSYTIPNSVSSIRDNAFYAQYGLTSVTIPDSVTSVGSSAFWNCIDLTNAVIGNGMTNIAGSAFAYCWDLTNILFQGNAPIPATDSTVFSEDDNAIAYYYAGTLRWGATFDGIPTVELPALGGVPPSITTAPLSQSAWPGSSVNFSVTAAGTAPLAYQWYFDGLTLPGATNAFYSIASVQATNAGSYSVTVTNAYGLSNAAATLTVMSTNVFLSAGWLTPDKDIYGSRNGGYATRTVDVSSYTNAWTLAGASAPLTGDVLGNSNSQLVVNVPNGIGIYGGQGTQLGFISTGAQLACLAMLMGTACSKSWRCKWTRTITSKF